MAARVAKHQNTKAYLSKRIKLTIRRITKRLEQTAYQILIALSGDNMKVSSQQNRHFRRL